MNDSNHSLPTEYTIAQAKQQQQQQQGIGSVLGSVQPYSYEQIRDGDISYPVLNDGFTIDAHGGARTASASSSSSSAAQQSARPSHSPAPSDSPLLTPEQEQLMESHRKAIIQWGWRVKACFAAHMVSLSHAHTRRPQHRHRTQRETRDNDENTSLIIST